MPTAASSELTTALLRHFDAHRREMPWRETSDPYAIWVSEVMLQQTRVDTVIPYWERWLDRFPTVEALAESELDDVLKHWEGLGYYSRARNLHAAARMVRERWRGVVPDSTEELRELPGVGDYTAGAVASIAFGVSTPAVDGNVRRVLSRLHDLEAPTAAELRDHAADLVPDDRPGDFNQALMELGATICTPRSPDCDACPVAEWCDARRLGVQELRPLPVERKSIPKETVRTVVALRKDGAVLLVRRPADGLLGGLWEFPAESRLAELVDAAGDGDGTPAPGTPVPLSIFHIARLSPISLSHPARDLPVPRPSTTPEGSREAANVEYGKTYGFEGCLELDPVIHTFSHKRVRYEPVVVPFSGTVEVGEDIAWVQRDQLDDYALPVAQQKIAAAVAVAVPGRASQPPVRRT